LKNYIKKFKSFGFYNLMHICSEIKATLKNKILPSAKIWFAIIQKIEKQYLFKNKIIHQ
jgi:hypothetical protein